MAHGSSFSSMLIYGMPNEEDQVVIPVQPRTVPPRKRRDPPDPDAEVIALSPNTLMATNRFICDVCHKGFPREQNLELHKRGHNLPWKLKQRTVTEDVKRKLYLCPEPSCINHNRSHALGDLTGIKKHYLRKHGVKKYKCQKCSKMYAVHSDLKAHSKTCGTKEYHCYCGTTFSRRDNFIAHRGFCDSLLEEEVEIRRPSTLSNDPSQMSLSLPHSSSQVPSFENLHNTSSSLASTMSQLGRTNVNSVMIKPSMDSNFYNPSSRSMFVPSSGLQNQDKYKGTLNDVFTNMADRNTARHNIECYSPSFMTNNINNGNGGHIGSDHLASFYLPSDTVGAPQLSATALLQKAAQLGTMSSNNNAMNIMQCYPKLSSSIGGTNNSQMGGHFSGSTSFGISDITMNGFPYSFSSTGVGSSIFNRNACNARNDIGFQQYNGVAFTRDFLGVGDETESNLSYNGPN